VVLGADPNRLNWQRGQIDSAIIGLWLLMMEVDHGEVLLPCRSIQEFAELDVELDL